jgi:riboflavin kinase|tara:strand:- start:510 stop:884 length:375 start_codon:yes stop_codon:yes gene_type:complete
METGALEPELSTVENGVYAGWCSVEGYPEVFKTVLSVGWNPHFEGTKKTVEPHVLHTFAEDFYGCEMRLLIVGYIRPQEKYSSLDELIAAIDADIECGRTSLDEPAHAALQSDPSLTFAASAST